MVDKLSPTQHLAYESLLTRQWQVHPENVIHYLCWQQSVDVQESRYAGMKK
jgi:hypothetical protein